jgi:hypothetical protein
MINAQFADIDSREAINSNVFEDIISIIGLLCTCIRWGNSVVDSLDSIDSLDDADE